MICTRAIALAEQFPCTSQILTIWEERFAQLPDPQQIQMALWKAKLKSQTSECPQQVKYLLKIVARNLGYMDPARIHLEDWKDKVDRRILYAPKAGEILFRLKSQ